LKKYLILLLLFSTIKVWPQKITQEPTASNAPYNANNIKLLKCQKMQRNGVIIICAGGVGTIVGMALFVDGLNHGISKTNSNSNSSNYLPQMYAGTIISTIGLLSIAQGTISYLVGKKRETKCNNNLSIYVTPSSFSITYKF
jgi:hypothetical protein